MKEKIIDDGIEYVRDGDCYIPNLKAPEGKYNIGKYGRLHSIFIKENRPCLYSAKMLNRTWLAYLEEIDTTAKEMVDGLIKDMVAKQGITEDLKAKDQMAWVSAMEQVKHTAEEFVFEETYLSNVMTEGKKIVVSMSAKADTVGLEQTVLIGANKNTDPYFWVVPAEYPSYPSGQAVGDEYYLQLNINDESKNVLIIK